MKKRAAVLHKGKRLFTLPDESHLGDCPICCLSLSINDVSNVFMPCCSKTICKGCHYANHKDEIKMGLKMRCAFCREPFPETKEKCDKRIMVGVKKNCPAAVCQLGKQHYSGGDYESALKYFAKVAKLGDAEAHYRLSLIC